MKGIARDIACPECGRAFFYKSCLDGSCRDLRRPPIDSVLSLNQMVDSGLTIQQIADKLNISYGAANGRIYRLRLKRSQRAADHIPQS